MIALLILASVALFVAYDAHTGEPQETTREQVTGEWSVDAEFTHAATVVGESSVFDAGERLEHRTVYFTRVMPELTAAHSLQYDTSDGTDAAATVNLSLLIQSIETVDGQDVIHWEERTTLTEGESLTIADGDEESTNVTVDVPEAQNRIDDIETELGTTPGDVELSIVAETSVTAQLDGEERTEQRTDKLVLELDTDLYRVSEDIGGSISVEQTEEVTITETPSAVILYGLPALAVISIGVALGLVGARRQGVFAVSEYERERYEFEAARKDFDDWISRGVVPDLEDRTVITVDSLEELVDTAIDSNRRVFEARDTDRYVVVFEDLVCEFWAPGATDLAVDPDRDRDEQSEDDYPDESTEEASSQTEK